MLDQDFVNEAAKVFIDKLGDKKFTVQDYRNIIYGTCANYLKRVSNEHVMLKFINDPSVQLNGVGMNGVRFNKHLKDVQEDKFHFKQRLVEYIEKKVEF